MKILILGRGLPGPGQPLLGIFEFQQARALAEAGHEVVYGALDIRFLQHRRPWGVAHFRMEGVAVIELSLPLGRLQYRGGYRLVARMWDHLYRVCVDRYGVPDVVHSHFIGWSAAAARVKRRRHYPLVVTEHTSGLMGPRPTRAMLRGIEIAYAGADVLIAVSPGLAGRIRELTGHDAEYVPNVVDARTFASVRPEPHPRQRIVSVGNLIPRKRMDALIEAFAAAEVDADLRIIGEGPDRGDLERLAAELGLGRRVSFAGGLTHEEIAAEFARADVFALASREETFGVVLIEAMAAGLPVVSTRSGGPEGFVIPEAGLLVGHAVPDLAAGLREALHREWDRDAIRAYAVAHHAPPVVAARLTELYDEAIRRARLRTT